MKTLPRSFKMWSSTALAFLAVPLVLAGCGGGGGGNGGGGGGGLYRAPRPGRAAELPTPVQARILNALGTSFQPQDGSLRTWLTADHYTSAGTDATVDGLKHVAGDGVFYIDAHGALGVGRDKVGYLSIWTATPQ